MLVIFIGPPGSGKGTQASRLCEHLSIAHLSTGDMFRAAIQEETELGLQAQQYMDRGELVPDQLVVEMVAEALRNAPYDDGCLLDGFPRSLPQAEALDQILAGEGKQVDVVLELDVDDGILIERLLARKRPDDTLDTIHNRLKVYQEQTSPLLNYYRERSLLTTVNGEGTVDEVHSEILEQALQKNE
ncbi:MAG: adenylate kinase [Pirellulaceae bacterium]